MPRCLVVEDDPSVRTFFERALEAVADLRVDVAGDAREGLALVTAYGTVERAIEAMRGARPRSSRSRSPPTSSAPARRAPLPRAGRAPAGGGAAARRGAGGRGAGAARGSCESELFGHDRGAFTGATRAGPGKFEAVQGGTIFLGETRPTKVDVRVVAAAHRNLEALVREGNSREDLFYRVNVLPVRIPPLRERAGRAPGAPRLPVARQRPRARARGRARGHHGRGERAHRDPAGPGRRAGASRRSGSAGRGLRRGPVAPLRPGPAPRPRAGRVDLPARPAHVHRGHLAAVARVAQINARTLYEKMREHGLRKEDFRRGPAEPSGG